MKTLLGSLYQVIYTMDKTHLIWFAVFALIALTLGILHTRIKGDENKLKLWKKASFVPIFLALIHIIIYVIAGKESIISFLPIYALALMTLIATLLGKRKIGYKVVTVITFLLSIACFIALLFMLPSNTYNFSERSYTESFHLMAQAMDKTYILKEWKDVDFSALEKKYMPMVEEAENEKNLTKYYDAVKMFCNELHDGHVGVELDSNEETNNSIFKNNEYGLCMVHLDNDEVIAVNTLPEVNQLGIEDGTVITKWDGKPIKAAAESIPDMGVPVKENAEFLSYIYLSAYGNETVDVSFINKEGTEQTVSLQNIGENTTCIKTLTTYSHRPNAKSIEEALPWFNENFSTKMLTDNVGYLRLNSEMLSVQSIEPGDIFGMLTGNHKESKEIFRKGLTELKAQGMEYLVIDLRGNTGGLDEIGCALASLLTNDYYFGQGLGIRKNGKYIDVSPDHAVHGTGEFADIKAVALTNYACVSAGDGTSLYLSKLPNVTLAGITNPNGSNQAVGGAITLANDKIKVSYPVSLILNENDEPNIDVKADRISRNPVEVHIPFDKNAALEIFHTGEDYELNWAINYLTQSNT
ncbi:S41 family peptidase [Butyrivibrio sp. AE2005]|uniref:S41 family peptidase n=1 Tax=Butyrivibrio sp. AE2005 TaxID=1496722 RepID=UPI000478C80A|nr:S41 family peptidase [Butyrivibrio sp. AE2005]